MPPVQTFYQSAFAPVLYRSPVLAVTDEQKFYIRKILEVSSSDSRFADKAYDAIEYVLTGGSVSLPVITSLNPGSATIGDPTFTLHVIGTGFGSQSLIVWNGSTEPTTFVSTTELTTVVDMSTATTAMDIPVMVQTGLGVMSEPMLFVLQPTGPALMGKKQPVVSGHNVGVKQEVVKGHEVVKHEVVKEVIAMKNEEKK